MRYATIRKFDVINGEGIGMSLLVQGCPFHCKGCFNPWTWDFNGGKEWDSDTFDRFMKLVNRPYIRRVSFLGGSPLCDENLKDVYNIIAKIKHTYPTKKIWVYTGMLFEDIIKHYVYQDDVHSLLELNTPTKEQTRAMLLDHIDVLVDGPFEYEKRDLTLAFRGSTNQRIIDVQASLSSRDIILKDIED